MDLSDLTEAYRRMVMIRRFEETVSVLYRDGEIPGFCHLSIGQEASATGACWPLADADVVTSTHRGHAHCLAKGLALEPMLAELMGKRTGTNGGLGGSMHIADPAVGIFGANGIVGAGLPIAVGAATASRLRDDGKVVVAFFGDGAPAQGAFHEAANLGALWSLPVVLFCENNHYAEFSAAESQHPVPLEARAGGYGIAFESLDGNDVEAVADAMTGIVDAVRGGAGPVLVEAVTYRWHGHYEGDPQAYRDTAELEQWKQERDPLLLARAKLQDRGADPALLTKLEEDIDHRLEDALAAARRAEQPDAGELFTHVTVERASQEERRPAGGAEEFRGMDAVKLALEHELEHDPEVFLAGVDVGAGGNIFGVTRGLHERWPDRVLDTPISETAVMGLAVGAAMAGMRPVVELMFMDFLGVCFDQIMNQAAKLPYMTNGRARMGLTIRTQFGAGRSAGAQHSQSLEALLAHIPGLSVVMPSTPADTYGLLRAAIRDPNPVIVVEHRFLYGRRGPRPPADHVVPIGKAAVVRPGRHVTLVSMSRMLHDCMAAAEELAGEGLEVEVVDLRTVAPLDMETVLDSVHRTSRLVIAHEAVTDFGIGAEIAARVADEGFWHLDSPIRRVGAAFTPAPYAPDLERRWLPDADVIAAAVRETAEI